MSEVTFTYRCEIALPVPDVYAHLTQPESYIGLSPLVTRVYDVSHHTNSEGQAVVQYVTVEHFRFLGFIPYNNHISVSSTQVNPDALLLNEVRGALNVYVRFENTFTPTEDGSGTSITEAVTIHCPGWLRGFVVGQAKSTQVVRFARLKTRLEAQ